METSIKIITCSGKKSDWPTWEERFLARAKKKCYKDILTGKKKGYKDILTGKPEDIPRLAILLMMQRRK